MRRQRLHASVCIEVVWVIAQWAVFSSCTPVVAPHGQGQHDAGVKESAEHATDPDAKGPSENAQDTEDPKQASDQGSTKKQPAGASGSGGSGAGGSRAPNTSASSKIDAGAQTQPDAEAADAASNAANEPVSMVPLEPDQTWVPPELADSDSLNTLSDLSLLPVLGGSRHRVSSSNERPGSASVTSTDLSYVNVIAHGNRDVNNFVCASADAEYKSESALPIQLDMETCPESYVRGLVLARAEGSGK